MPRWETTAAQRTEALGSLRAELARWTERLDQLEALGEHVSGPGAMKALAAGADLDAALDALFLAACERAHGQQIATIEHGGRTYHDTGEVRRMTRTGEPCRLYRHQADGIDARLVVTASGRVVPD